MAERLAEAELLRRLAGCPPTGALYRHHGTRDVYRVLGRALRESDLTPLVLCARPFSLVTFARPLAEFEGLVTDERGFRRQRFERVEGSEAAG